MEDQVFAVQKRSWLNKSKHGNFVLRHLCSERTGILLMVSFTPYY